MCHRSPTAAADPLAVAGPSPSRRLDVVPATPAPSLSPRAPLQRRLRALATDLGEPCGLDSRTYAKRTCRRPSSGRHCRDLLRRPRGGPGRAAARRGAPARTRDPRPRAGRRVLLASGTREPGGDRLARGGERLRRRDDGAHRTAPGERVRGDPQPGRRGRLVRSLPRRRLLVLHPLRGGEAVPDPRPPSGGRRRLRRRPGSRGRRSAHRRERRSPRARSTRRFVRPSVRITESWRTGSTTSAVASTRSASRIF